MWMAFEVVAAKPKAESKAADLPNQSSMRESSAEKIRRNPSSDQKKIRRQMTKKAGVERYETGIGGGPGQVDIPTPVYTTDAESEANLLGWNDGYRRRDSRDTSTMSEEQLAAYEEGYSAGWEWKSVTGSAHTAGPMFPGPGAEIYRNDAGEVTGWDDGASDGGDPYDEYDRDDREDDYSEDEAGDDEDDFDRESSLRVSAHAIADHNDIRPLHTRVAALHLKKG
jgi:hypothetical protein